MSDHLPECPLATTCNYAAGLDAAREAVAGLPIPTLPERLGILTSMLFRGDVLAAIDALRKEVS